MRIGVVTEYYYPSIGGIQEHVHHFARDARRLGHTVKIVTSTMPDVEVPPEPSRDVIRIGSSVPVYLNGGFGRVTIGAGLSRAMRQVLARERFDVVHVHAPLTPVLPLLAIHHATGPVVGTFHTHFRPNLLFRLMHTRLQRYLDRLDAAVAVSHACLTAFQGSLQARFRIIPNGVDAEWFGQGRRLRRFDDGRFNLLYVGRVEPRNGLDRLIQAFIRVRREIDARLLVLGDGPLLPRYQALVPRKLSRDVVFAGRVLEERPDWYASADVFCAPARIASFGVTLLEAMAAGRPVLAADIDGFREVLEHGREGERVPPDDPEAWARAIVRLAGDPERATRYGERGRVTAQRHAWPSITREILGLYRSLGVAG
ncbi:MAG TPA: glycosyltransferase family 4 protein [Anaeromyxobacter sp.]|nr:glycosyltransferase family 4 protein [Anaeromyxobacter sp.]